MIDTGLAGEPFLIRRLVRKLGFKPDSIKTILLTHGHLDHAGNLDQIESRFEAGILPRLRIATHVLAGENAPEFLRAETVTNH